LLADLIGGFELPLRIKRNTYGRPEVSWLSYLAG
jgi:hypothetical protein